MNTIGFGWSGRMITVLLLVRALPGLCGGGDPIQMGSWPTAGHGFFRDVIVRDHLAFCSTTKGLEILDVSDPEKPRFLGGHSVTGGVFGVTLTDAEAWLAAGTKGIQILDVAEPAHPRIVRQVATGGETVDVELANGHAFVVNAGQGLRIIDITDPEQPMIVGACCSGGEPHSITLHEGNAYLATRSRGVVLVDVTDPSSPVDRGSIQGLRVWASEVSVVGAHAYSGTYQGMMVLDVRDPRQVTMVGLHPAIAPALALTAAGDLLLALQQDNRLEVIDISDPSKPARLTAYSLPRFALHANYNIPAEPWLAGVSVKGRHVFVGYGWTSLQVLDLERLPGPLPTGGTDTPGEAHGVVTDGERLFVADGRAGLRMLDIGNPEQPVPSGWYQTAGTAYHLALSGHLMAIANGPAGLQLLDISNPSTPRLLSTLPADDTVQAVSFAGHHLWAVTGDGLEVLDISEPSMPRRIGAVDLAGVSYHVAVARDRAFVVDSLHGVDVVDVGNPLVLSPLGRIATAFSARSVAVSGETALLVNMHGQLAAIDVTPHLGEAEGAVSTGVFASRIALAEDQAFVASGNDRLQWFDISNAEKPRLLNTASARGPATGVTVSGHHAYVTVKDQGIDVFSVRYAPEPVGIYPTISVPAWNIAADGDHLHVVGDISGLHVLKVTDAPNPEWMGSSASIRDGVAVAVSEGKAYVADSRAGLRVIDVSDPIKPALLGLLEEGIEGSAVAVAGEIAYLGDRHFGLRIVDVSDPEHPELISSLELTGQITAVEVVGDLAFLTTLHRGLRIIDVSTPGAPREIASHPLVDSGRDVAVSDGIAYVASTRALEVIDVHEPSNPQFVGRHGVYWGGVVCVEVAGNYAYVGTHPRSLEVVEIADPSNPKRVGSATGFQVSDLVVQGSRLFVAAGNLGVLVFSTEHLPERFPRFSARPQVSDGTVRLSLSAAPGTRVTLQRSTDLRVWEDWRTVLAGPQPLDLIDHRPDPVGHEFYRAVAP